VVVVEVVGKGAERGGGPKGERREGVGKAGQGWRGWAKRKRGGGGGGGWGRGGAGVGGGGHHGRGSASFSSSTAQSAMLRDL
jgi:hypothetical protein